MDMSWFDRLTMTCFSMFKCMRIQTLELQQFRSYPQLQLDFSAGDIHVLVGSNGAGKTNILEAISILSLTKSCLGSEEQDIVEWGKEFYRVRGKVLSDTQEESMLEVVSQFAPRKQKACFKNDVRTSVTDMVGQLPIVLFLPQDLELFSGAPAHRRSFLDQLLFQISPAYYENYSQYHKILKQRSSLLRKITEGVGHQRDLAVWDQGIAEKGAAITLERLELIEVLQCSLTQEVQALGESWEDVQFTYQRKGTERELKAMTQELLALLEHYRERDIILQTTTVGPHREDWQLEADGRELTTFASRGQQRTAVLALLFLQVSFLELKRGEKPLVLLDDVFSELDDHHQRSLLNSFDGHQVLITTTHVPPLLEKLTLWQVQKGTVLRGVPVD